MDEQLFKAQEAEANVLADKVRNGKNLAEREVAALDLITWFENHSDYNAEAIRRSGGRDDRLLSQIAKELGIRR